MESNTRDALISVLAHDQAGCAWPRPCPQSNSTNLINQHSEQSQLFCQPFDTGYFGVQSIIGDIPQPQLTYILYTFLISIETEIDIDIDIEIESYVSFVLKGSPKCALHCQLIKRLTKRIKTQIHFCFFFFCVYVMQSIQYVCKYVYI